MISPSLDHLRPRSLALALLCGLLLVCAACAGAPSSSEPPPAQGGPPPRPVPTSASAAGPTTASAAGPTTASAAGPTPGVVTPDPGNAGDDPDPTPASIERKVAIEAPKRMEQGSTTNLYLSFGAPERRANLPGSAGNQQSSSPAVLPATGVVQPGLNVTGNVRVEAVDVEPVSVENAIPKRWHWRITVSKDEPAIEPVVISPYLKYSETPGDASRVIWPEQDLELTIEVSPPPVRQRLMSFIGDASATLQLFGASVVMLIAWVYSFGKWVWPRLNSQPQPAPAKTETEPSTPNA